MGKEDFRGVKTKCERYSPYFGKPLFKHGDSDERKIYPSQFECILGTEFGRLPLGLGMVLRQGRYPLYSLDIVDFTICSNHKIQVTLYDYEDDRTCLLDIYGEIKDLVVFGDGISGYLKM